MPRDIQDRVEEFLASDTARDLAGTAVTKVLKGVAGARSGGGRTENPLKRVSGSAGKGIAGAAAKTVTGGKGVSGVRGLAAGAGVAALAPMAAKGIGKLIKGDGASTLAGGPKKLAEDAGSKLGSKVGNKVSDKIDDAGGPSGILKDTVKSALPFGGGGGTKNQASGTGKGRRMPIQQSVDVAVPVETAYNEWTQFEDWPNFMHRVTRVNQEDPCTVSFVTKIWGKTKEFKAEIETQRPDERIKWKVTEGITHTGVVTFHELAPRLTRIELELDVQPGSLIEKAARGMRHVKRAARGDLHRFKAFIEMLEKETGAWRGVIEDGEVVEDHDPKYDKKREYGSVEDLMPESEDSGDDEQDDDDEKQQRRGSNGSDPGQRPRQSRGTRSSQRKSSGRTDSRAQSRSGSSARGSASASRGSASASRSSGSASRSSGSSARGSKSANGSSGGSGRSSSGSSRSSSNRSSSRSSNGSTGGSGRSRGSSGSKASPRSSGRTRSSGSSSNGSSRSAKSSSASHQGRQRSGSSRRG